ncbi:phosphatase PAP2 family protein [Candidatus Sumerlaeota bacterium]|nr:phosphatase PAP2 family protein [Candidatus Sumerlaeota bacterium]
MEGAKNATLTKRSFLRAIDVLNLSYVGLIGILILVFHKNLERWVFYFALHVVMFAGQLAFYRLTAFTQNRVWRFIRDLITPLLLIFYYEETEKLNHIIAPYYLDPFFAHVEEMIFGAQPALEFYKWIPHPLFSEYMHFSYFSYYLLIPALGVPLWFSRRHEEYDSFIFGCLLTMVFCFTFFIAVPCAGPWRYFASQTNRWNFPGYIFVPLMEIILKYGEIANGAFPSSHVAMATVILLCSYQYHRLIFWIMLPCVISLFASTVYTQAHYLIDVPSGFLVGLFFFMVRNKVKNGIEKILRLRRSDDIVPEKT